MEYNVSNAGVLTPSTYYFPRACISRHKIVNADFNFVPYTAGNTASVCGNVFFSGYLSVNNDAEVPI